MLAGCFLLKLNSGSVIRVTGSLDSLSSTMRSRQSGFFSSQISNARKKIRGRSISEEIKRPLELIIHFERIQKTALTKGLTCVLQREAPLTNISIIINFMPASEGWEQPKSGTFRDT
jgi:hypothetical protein